ncbi:MAG: MMPL family transporter, partial [Clostridia bacterium]|nr:MMPL family transporter [Clostridia bacterium]
MQSEFGIRGYATLVVRVDENDANNITKLTTAIDNIKNIKVNDKNVVSNITWYGTVEEYSDIKNNTSTIIDKIADNKEQYIEIAQKLSDAGYFSDLNNLKNILDIAQYKGQEFISTTEMENFLRQETKTANVYDYIILVMANIEAGDVEYEFLDRIKSEFSYTTYSSTGTTETAQKLLNETMKDLPWFILASVLIVLVILFITTSSFIEPLILLVTLLVGIIVSMGINYLYPSISIISFAISAVLQLAITMDYAVFFMHTYRKNKTNMLSEEAIIATTPEVALSIIASGLTTIGGFIALYFMQFKIGTDIANVLIKGILTSMISVLLLQPILTYMLDKIIDKTNHNFISKLNNKINEKRLKENKKEIEISKASITRPIGKLSIKARIILIIVAIGLIAPAYIFQSKVEYSYLNLYEKKNSTEEDILANEVGNQLILSVPIQTINNKTHQDFIEDVLKINTNRITGMIGVFTAVDIKPEILLSLLDLLNNNSGSLDISSLKEYLTEPMYASYLEQAGITETDKELLIDLLDTFELYSNDTDFSTLNQYFKLIDNKWYTLYTISFSGNTEDAEAQNAYKQILELSVSYFGNNNYYPVGLITSSYEMSQITPRDFLIVSLVSIAIIYLIVTLLLRNPLKSLIIVAIIELGIWINLAITYFTGNSINFVVYIIISSVQLGCTVDYAILFANTFEKNRKMYKNGKDCAINTAIETIPPITQSALLISAVCFSLYLISSNLIIKQLTGMLARGAVFSYLLVVLLQPGIWSFFKTERRIIDYKKKINSLDEKITNLDKQEDD